MAWWWHLHNTVMCCSSSWVPHLTKQSCMLIMVQNPLVLPHAYPTLPIHHFQQGSTTLNQEQNSFNVWSLIYCRSLGKSHFRHFSPTDLRLSQRRAGKRIKILWKIIVGGWYGHAAVFKWDHNSDLVTTRLCNKLCQCAPTQEQGEIGNYFSWDRHRTLDELSASVHLELKPHASVRQLVKISSKKKKKKCWRVKKTKLERTCEQWKKASNKARSN